MNFFGSSKVHPPTLSKSFKRRAAASLSSWRPRTADEIVRKKNRKIVSQHLKRIGKAAGRQLSLDQDGVCCFSFKRFVVVVEVPEDHCDACLFYSKVCHLGPFDNIEEVQRFVDIYNHRQASTTELQDVSSASEATCAAIDPSSSSCYGTRLTLKDDEEEVNLCLSIPIQGLSFQNTADYMEYFVKTAVAVNRKLQKIQSLPLPPPPPRPQQQQQEQQQLGPMSGNDEQQVDEAPITRGRFWSLDSQTSVSNMSQCNVFSLFSSSSTSMSTPTTQEPLSPPF